MDRICAHCASIADQHRRICTVWHYCTTVPNAYEFICIVLYKGLINPQDLFIIAYAKHATSVVQMLLTDLVFRGRINLLHAIWRLWSKQESCNINFNDLRPYMRPGELFIYSCCIGTPIDFRMVDSDTLQHGFSIACTNGNIELMRQIYTYARDHGFPMSKVISDELFRAVISGSSGHNDVSRVFQFLIENGDDVPQTAIQQMKYYATQYKSQSIVDSLDTLCVARPRIATLEANI